LSYVHLPRDQFPALESFLHQSFGEPTIAVANTDDGGKVGFYGAKVMGANLVFGCNREAALVRIARDYQDVLIPVRTSEEKADFLVSLSESWEMPARAQDDRFTLTAKLLPPADADTPLRLALELHNFSGQTQQVGANTNLFEGRVYLRATNGDVHEFIATRYWKMLGTTTWIEPTLELPPGASCRFEHPLSDFIDDHRLTYWDVGVWSAMSFPSLDAEFLPGCELRCAMRVIQWKMFDDRSEMQETTAIVVSAPVRHP
jgi:hypothetical protein